MARRRDSRRARVVERLSLQRCPVEGSQEIVVSGSICSVVNNLTIHTGLDAGRGRSSADFFMPSHGDFVSCEQKRDCGQWGRAYA